jgi:hypothetical protein
MKQVTYYSVLIGGHWIMIRHSQLPGSEPLGLEPLGQFNQLQLHAECMPDQSDRSGVAYTLSKHSLAWQKWEIVCFAGAGAKSKILQ